MKRSLTLLFLSLVVTLGLSMAAFASDQIVFTGGVESHYGATPVGLYAGTLNGVATKFVCDDYDGHIGPGSTWMANPWSLTQAAIPGNGTYAGPPYHNATYGPGGSVGGYTTQQVYDAAGYLANLLFTNPSYSAATVANIQYAIWGLMDNPYQPPAGAAPWIATGLANDTYTNANLVVYSPDGNLITKGPFTGDTPQELIGEIPEPISMALMGTFLSLAGFGLGKKKLFS